MANLKRRRWHKIVLLTIIVIGLSVGLAYLLQYLMTYFDVPLDRFATTAYLIVFVVTLAVNASIMVPVAIHLSVMAAAASLWDPVLVALTASVAGTLGEMTGYYAGYLGKKIMFTESTPGYDRLASWMKRYGPWAIFLISLQPVLPVDIAGLLSGASRIPLWKFMLPCWAGKFLKYLVLCYFGFGFFNLFPF